MAGLGDGVNKYFSAVTDAAMSNLSAEEVKKQLLSVEEIAVQVMNRFGQGRENIVAIKAGLADAADEIFKMGGNFEDVVKAQTEASSSLGRNVVLTKETAADLFATNKVTGQSIKQLVDGFKDVGVGTGKIAENMTMVMKTASAIGVSGKDVSTQVVDNLKLMNTYNFQGGVEGLAKMAAQAVNLRITVKDIGNVMNKAFSPEGAIDMAAALQRLGMAQSQLLDPLRLLDLSRNDPTELQNQIAQMSKQFVQLGKDGRFEIMPGAKEQLREVAAALGMSEDALAKMALAGSELEHKLSKIKFPEFADENQQKMIANLAEMDKTGEYKIKFQDAKGETQTKSIDQLTATDIEAITEAQKNAPKNMEDYAKQQLDVQKEMEGHLRSLAGRTGRALAGTKTGEDLLQAPKVISEKVTDIASGTIGSTEQLRGVIGPESQKILDNLNSVVNGENSVASILTTLSSSFTTLETYLNGNFATTLANSKTSFDELTTSSNKFLNLISNTVSAGTKMINKAENLTGIGNPEQNITTSNKTTNTTLPLGEENKNKGEGNKETKTTEGKYDINHNLNINVTGVEGMSAETLKKMFENENFKEQVVKAYNDATRNGMNIPPIKRQDDNF